MSEKKQGRRVYAKEDGSLHLTAGDYGFHPHAGWQCVPFGFPPEYIGGLANHHVVEHEDGTISVSPSILITGGDVQWHGYLERGVFREV